MEGDRNGRSLSISPLWNRMSAKLHWECANVSDFRNGSHSGSLSVLYIYRKVGFAPEYSKYLQIDIIVLQIKNYYTFVGDPRFASPYPTADPINIGRNSIIPFQTPCGPVVCTDQCCSIEACAYWVWNRVGEPDFDPWTTVHAWVKGAQITATRDESQRIVGQCPLSTLTIPGCC